jgi:hypothetical protein
MEISIYVCADAPALVAAEMSVPDQEVIYRSMSPETGEAVRYLVGAEGGTISSGATVDQFNGKFILIAIVRN